MTFDNEKTRNNLLRGLGSLIVFLGVRRTIFFAATAAAATIVGVTLTGLVPQRIDLQIVPNGAQANMDLSLNRTAPFSVASLTAKSNWPHGYSVTVVSTNVGAASCGAPCLFSDTTDDSLLFTLYRDISTIAFTSAAGTFAQNNGKSLKDGDVYDVRISYDGTAVLLSQAADYREILTFTLALD